MQECFSNEASKQIQSDNIDMKISVLKSLQTKWIYIYIYIYIRIYICRISSALGKADQKESTF